MKREQYQQMAVGLGIVAALASGRLPRWLRVTLVAGLVLIAAGAGVLASRYSTQQGELEKRSSGDVEAGEASSLSLATRRLEYLASRRRLALTGRSGPPLPA